MSHAPQVFITGFGPFEDFGLNPSGALIEHLLREPPDGIEVGGVVLPVSFRRSLETLDATLGERAPDRAPRLLVGLGVHRGHGFRCELRARRNFSTASRPDVDGLRAGGPGSGVGAGEEDLWTGTEGQLRSFIARRPRWYLSSSAGGYVCEHVYRRILEAGKECSSPALFVHVPPADCMSVELQAREISELLVELLVRSKDVRH